MKNKKLAFVVTSSILAGSVMLGGTAFAQTTGTTPNILRGGSRPDSGLMRGRVAGHEKDLEVRGTVTSVSGTTITIKGRVGPKGSAGIVYTVDASHAKVTKGGASSSVASIAVDDALAVEGTVNGTSVVATAIRDGMMARGGTDKQGGARDLGERRYSSTPPVAEGNGQPIIGGTVTAISGTTISITNKSNVSYTIDASAAKLRRGDVVVAVTSISVGDSVIVQGTVSGNSVSASTIFDQKSSAAGSPHAGERGGQPASRKGVLGAISGFFGF